MKVKDRIDKLRQDGLIVNHKALGNTKLEDWDWLRIYKSAYRGCIDEKIYFLDVKDIDAIPEEVLNLEFDEEDCWMIGGFLSLDLIIKV